MVSRRHLVGLVLVAVVATAAPCAGQEAVSRATTVHNLPDVPPGPVVEALSRALTVHNLPDVPPGPITEALSRALTVHNLPDVPPGPITEALSRALTVHNLPDVPPGPITEAFSRPLTVHNLPDVPPSPITEAVSRSLTVHVDPLSGAAEEEIPKVFALRGARPNPFNPVTTIGFDVPRTARVHLRIYDLRGALVAELLGGDVVPAGRREAVWDGRDLRGRAVASGVYLCRMRAGRFSATLPLTLLK